MISEAQLQDLANMIYDRIKGDFEWVFYSGNLRDTVEIKKVENGFNIIVNADMYDIPIYNQTNVIVYTGEGSYAEAVNKQGGFSKKHTRYIERAIQSAVMSWMLKYNLKGSVSER
jgi:hypothetical protein